MRVWDSVIVLGSVSVRVQVRSTNIGSGSGFTSAAMMVRVPVGVLFRVSIEIFFKIYLIINEFIYKYLKCHMGVEEGSGAKTILISAFGNNNTNYILYFLSKHNDIEGWGKKLRLDT